MLRHYGVQPVLVFDGGGLPMKSDQEIKRARYVAHYMTIVSRYFETYAYSFLKRLVRIGITDQAVALVLKLRSF